jgi:hypothetical protein
MEKLSRLLLLLAIVGAGCVAPVGASSVSIPRDARNVCLAQCGQIGMGLSAVAIMANNIGCVCQGGYGAPMSQAEPSGGATATAGMATIAMLRQQQEAAAAQNRRMMFH